MEDADNQTKKPVELTKKQELNNHIVLMRKVVRTARVHIINKLTKDVKKLKERKGDEKALEKTKRKLERFLQEIQSIKHLREDKVSIYALQDKTKLEEVLQNSKATTENRALSRFSHHKLVQGEVLKYRSQNPYWDLQIPVLLERSKDKRRRINKKLTEREAELLARANKKKTNGKELPIGEDSSSEIDENGEESEEDADTSVDKSGEDNLETSLDKDIVGLTEDLDSIPTKTKPKTKIPTLKPIVPNKKVNAQQKKQQTALTKPLDQYKEISKTAGTVRVQYLKDLTDLDNSDDIIKPEEFSTVTVNSLSSNVPKPRPKSSFFVGGVDEILEEPPQERRTVDNNKKRDQFKFQKNTRQSHNEASEAKPVFRKGKLVNSKSFNKGGRPSNQRGANPKKGRFQTEGGANSNLTPLGDRTKEGKGDSIPKKSASSTTTQSEKLHPSWEAKKRQQQPTLSAFKGKKIKFDDD